jgi:phospho-N-acetylmuramoyl-pentapeptide-transferase
VRAILLSSGLAVICSLLGTRMAIGWFTRHGFGQPIRDDGPTTHHVKRGTPTMGGLVILVSATAAYLVATMLTGGPPSASAWLLLLLFLGCGVVGFLDDFIKVYTQNNQGLTSRAKMAGQTVVALGFGLLATQFFADELGVRPASSYISTTHDWGIKLPLVVVLLVIWFIVTATSNGANLADGADGLLAGTSAMIFGAYTLVNIWQNNHRCGSLDPTVVSQCYQARDPLDLAVFSAAIATACIGFLWWNANPARIIWATSARLPSEVRWPAWRSCPGPSSS